MESSRKPKEATKITLFLQKSAVPKVESKSKTITLFPKKAKDLTPIKASPFSHEYSVRPGGIFSVQDAVKCLIDLNHFICNQEAKVVTWEEKQAEYLKIESMDREINRLQEAVQQMEEEGKAWHKSIALAEAENQRQYAKLLGRAQDFGTWADGLKEATEKQFQEVNDRIVQLISDNHFLMNRITPLVELEKATLNGQGVTGVLLAEADSEALKAEVFEYTKELWGQTTSMFEEHLAMPIDKFKAWFEAAGDNAIRIKNAKLKAKIAELEKRLDEAKQGSKVQIPIETITKKTQEEVERKAKAEMLAVLEEEKPADAEKLENPTAEGGIVIEEKKALGADVAEGGGMDQGIVGPESVLSFVK